MSWFLSWLPGLPSIDFALPSSIQRRFISFALKKSLQRVLRPSQFIVHQVDSQIESGHVQIKDLEVDNEAINSMLIGLPIKLRTGSISAVTVQIPWPNPLTSTVGLSIQSLHLIFHIAATSKPISLSTPDIADSLASGAKSFIHNVLTRHEETTLRGFFNSDSASSFHDYTHRMPGSVDPFLHPTDNQENDPEDDPAGMVIFATLVKRLLANSELDAIDTKVTIIHPGHASFTFSIAEIRYRINTAAGKASGGDKAESEQTSRETRYLSILGLTVSARDLLPSPMLLTPSPASSVSPDGSSRFPFGPLSPHRSPPVSAVSSASPLSEDLEIAVSESLANLQLQLTPDAPSAPSSMPNETIPLTFVDRHKATDRDGRRSVILPSGSHSCSETEFLQPSSTCEEEDMAREPDFKSKDEMILSHGPEPLVIRLIMPSTSALMQDLAEESPSSSKGDKSGGATNIRYRFSAGVFACAFRAWHIRSMLDMLDAWALGSHQTPALSVTPSKWSSSANFVDTLCALGLDACMKVRGVVMLLLPSTILGEPFLPDSFFDHPFVPPQLPQGYVYISLENLSTSCSLSHPTPTAPIASQTRTRAAATSKTNYVTIDFTLENLSAFALLAIQTTNHDKQPLALPILITDQSLHMQYPVTHIHPSSHVREKHDYPSLPDFSILDWTAEAHHTSSTAIPPWRTEASAMASQAQSSDGVHAPPLRRGHSSKSGSGNVPAISMKTKFTWASSESGQYNGRGLDDHVEIDVVPLHIFVDLGLVLSDNALAFLDEMVSCRTDVVADGRNSVGDGKYGEERDERTEGESDNGKVDGLVYDTLGLDVDGQDTEPAKKGGLARISHSSLRPQAEKSRRSGLWQRLRLTVNLTMIRFEFRCPPPPSQAPRSGAVIIDLHGMEMSSGGSAEARSEAKVHPTSPPSATPIHERPAQIILLTADCHRLVIATSLPGQEIARIILSLGSICSEDEHTCDFFCSDFSTSPPLSSTSSTYLSALKMHLSRSTSPTSSFSKSSVLGTLAVVINSPSAHGDLPKHVAESLQLWADDVSQFDASRLVEQNSVGDTGDIDIKRESRFMSLIKGLFFTGSRRYGRSNAKGMARITYPEARIETVISLTLSKVFMRLERPRDHEESLPTRSLDTFASDADVVIEIKPDGKDETLITLGVMDLKIYDTSHVGAPEPFVAFAHRSYSTTPKSIVQFQFIPQTTESSI